MARREARDDDRRSSRGSHEARRKGVDGREGSGRNNYGQEHRGKKSPFAGASPMEARAPGERYDNLPRGPRLGSSGANQGGGGKPSESLDSASRKDEAKHLGRN